MARSRTLQNLLLDVRRRTNQENSTFVTDLELTEYLNQALAELWGRLVLNQGAPHYRSETSISVVSGTALYALPADFWTMQEVTGTVNSLVGTIPPFSTTEHAVLSNGSALLPFGSVRYRIQADNIEFRPSTESFTATLYYSPCQPRLTGTFDANGALTASSSTFDGFNGYELAAIYDACAQVCAKEETDPSFFLAQRDRIYARIDALAAHRDMQNPERVQDVSSHPYPESWDGGWYR